MHLESRPARARIAEVASSEVWGTTPFDGERAAAPGTITLRFEKPRFDSAVVTLAADPPLFATVELRTRR